MSDDLIDEAKHMARVAALQRELVEDEADECRAFAADRERQRRPYGVPSAVIIPFPVKLPC